LAVDHGLLEVVDPGAHDALHHLFTPDGDGTQHAPQWSVIPRGEPGVVLEHDLGEDPLEEHLGRHRRHRGVLESLPGGVEPSRPGYGVVVQQGDDVPVGVTQAQVDAAGEADVA
jgi:hypothetical protein